MHDLHADGGHTRTQSKCTDHLVRKDILQTLLKHHQQKAIWLLITGDLSKFDPLIGDMSCEMRPPFLIDMHWKVQAYLDETNRLDDAMAIAHEYHIAHQNDTDSKTIRTTADLDNKTHPKAYDDLFAELISVLGDDHTKLLGLCYSLTVSNFHARDEFGSIFYFTSIGLFTHEQLPMLRHELATACVDYFCNAVVATLGRSELDEAARKMISFIPQRQPGLDDIPVVAAHTQFHAILRYQYHTRRPIIVMVRRIEIDHSELDGLIYTLNDARALFWVPNRQGAYVLSTPVAPEQEQEPCVVFSCWNTHYKGEDGPGLKAADSAQYFENLSKCDISWLITTMAAAHQPYPNRAPAACDKHSEAYRKVGVADGVCVRDFEYCREACAGFNLDHQSPETHPSLYEECYLAEQLASKGYSFSGAKLLPIGPRPRQCYSRTGEAVDFTAEHVRTLSYMQAKQFCTYLINRHSQTHQPLGQYVVRIGENGVSCIDKSFADGLMCIKSTTRRKASYLEEYGGNHVSLTPLLLCYS